MFYISLKYSTKLLQCMSGGEFSVFTLSFVNTVLNQSAIRIHKCYIITIHRRKFLEFKVYLSYFGLALENRNGAQMFALNICHL